MFELERMVGVLVGGFVGLAIAAITIVICNKNKKFKTNYDERQQIERGKAYKYSFYAMCAYYALLMAVFIGEVPLPFDMPSLMFLGIAVGLLTNCEYSIIKGAYWGMNNDPKKYSLSFLIITALNIFLAIMQNKNGMVYSDGQFHSGMVNVICAIIFVILGLTLAIKSAIKRNDREEE